MEKFIVVSQQAKEEFDTEISSTPFKSVEEFINFYNSGIISKRAPLVTELLAGLKVTYKDIEEKSGQIIFLDPAEVYLQEVLEELQPWKLITKIKREVQTALENGKINDSSALVFSPASTGYLCRVERNEEGENLAERIGVEKLFTKPEDVKEVFEKYSSTGEGGDGTYYFYTSDFSSLEDNFIQHIHSLIPGK